MVAEYRNTFFFVVNINTSLMNVLFLFNWLIYQRGTVNSNRFVYIHSFKIF